MTKKCLEAAKQEKKEKEAGKPCPEPRRILTTSSMRQSDSYATPHISTSPSSSTYTVTVSLKPGEATTTTTVTNPTGGSTPHAEMKKTTGMKPESYNTSGSVMKKRVEQGLPHQALTLFAPVGMAEDLTKVQPILCKEVKTEKEKPNRRFYTSC